MKKCIIVLVVLFSTVIQGLAQGDLSDYSFVIVPEEYKFLSSKDQFQLNSMTKFLFNKNGFNAFYQKELSEVKLCDGLVAEISEESNITRTKLYITLKDCNGSIVHVSEMGTSKFKEYRKAYQAALRNCFKSIAKLNVNQKEVVFTSTSVDKKSDLTLAIKAGALPQKTFNQYMLAGVAYLLKKKGEGFSLFQESALADNGLLFVGEIVKIKADYVCIMDDVSYPVSFKSNMDVVIYKEERLMTLEFQN